LGYQPDGVNVAIHDRNPDVNGFVDALLKERWTRSKVIQIVEMMFGDSIRIDDRISFTILAFDISNRDGFDDHILVVLIKEFGSNS
jgi:hypothetical protein